MWKPENYGKKFYGPSTLRMGVEKSRNLMTVRVAQELGIDKIINFSKKLKIYENPEELMSISLGSAETTLLKITSAYCSFVNGGKLIEPIFLDRIQDSEGITIYSSERRTCEKCKDISYLGDEIYKLTDAETRVTVLGHVQRGAQPTHRDRLIASAFGVHAVDLIARNKFNRVVVWKNRSVQDVSLDDIAGNIALDYGIYGVPETFFIDPDGKIFYKHIGVVSMDLLEKKLKPFL